MNYFGIEDDHLPPVPKPSLQQWDNYQIYTLVCTDETININRTQYIGSVDINIDFENVTASSPEEAASLAFYSPFTQPWAINNDGVFAPLTIPDNSEITTNNALQNFLAIQSFAPTQIKVDFLSIVNSYSDVDTTPYTVNTYGLTNRVATDVIKRDSSGITEEWSYWSGNTGNLSFFPSSYYSRKLARFVEFASEINLYGNLVRFYRGLANFFEKIITQSPFRIDNPKYIDLLKGYVLDDRLIPKSFNVTPDFTGMLTVGYYRENDYEPIPGLRSIDWHSFSIEVIKGKAISLSVTGLVLGTLFVNNTSLKSQLINLITLPDTYPYRFLFYENLGSLFAEWNSLYIANIPIPALPGTLLKSEVVTTTSRIIRRLGANNNFWNNAQEVQDIGIDLNHELFAVDNQRAYDWHIKPQLDGSYGDLVMNSPLLENIGAALNVGKWAVNPDDPTTPRKDDLGWRIERLCDVFGIRVKTDGSIDVDAQKKLVRRVIKEREKPDPTKHGVVTFGESGMALKRITNRFKGKDEIVSDQTVIVQDIPQLIQEYFDQFNLALGIQESSAIEIKDCKNTARFDNQLGLLIEIFNLLSSANEMTRANLVSSLVAQSQTSEIIAGLGLPSVTKTIPISIDKKVTQLPYKGIAPHRSISQEVATCTANVGIVLGQLL